jgi:hypothetical protein
LAIHHLFLISLLLVKKVDCFKSFRRREFKLDFHDAGDDCKQPFSLTIRFVEAGYLSSNSARRGGRVVNPSPQFGQTPCKSFSTQSAQNVHSNEQIIASPESGGKSLAQHSQKGRSSNISILLFYFIVNSYFTTSVKVCLQIGSL